MSSKRKRTPTKKSNPKRGKKKEESDFDSDLTDDSENDCNQQDEILIAGHGDILDDSAPPLPEELLKSLIKPAGQMLIFGLINWEYTGRREKGLKAAQMASASLFSPHRFTDLRVRLAASGCVSPHTVIVTEEGKAMTFGRNQYGQLGINNTTTKDVPVLVETLKDMNIIGAACGRNHTLFLTESGTVYACGDNRSGQCGVGNAQATILTPTRINYRGAPIVKVGCGADFSVILDIKGGLHTFGLPEYGQLGHNTDGKYIRTSNRICYNHETSPKRIVLYIEKNKDGHVSPVEVSEIVDFSCGQNHTVAIDSKKRAFSWGFGAYGRLGHAVPKDEYVPRLIKYFDSQARGVRSITCGSTFSLAITDIGGLFLFGQAKRSGEANMYPKPVQDLTGWNIHHVAAGQTSVIIAADESVIAWGASPTFGELGLGDFQKSSSTPKEVSRLKGVKILGVAMGLSHTVLIAKNETEEQKLKLESFDVFEPKA